MRLTYFDGIAFTEGRPPVLRAMRKVSIRLSGGLLGNAQLQNLDDVKKRLARIAHRSGANAVIEFEYGQRSVGALRALFSWDGVEWYGSGMLAVLSPAEATRQPS